MNWANLGYDEIAKALDNAPVLVKPWHKIKVSTKDLKGPWIRYRYGSNTQLGLVFESTDGRFLWEVNRKGSINAAPKNGEAADLQTAKNLVDETLKAMGVMFPPNE